MAQPSWPVAGKPTAEMSPWQVSIPCADAHAVNFGDAVEEGSQSLSYVNLGDDQWRVEAVFPEAPDRERILMAVTLTAAALGVETPEVTIERLPPTDWLVATYRAFPPLSIGRYWVYGSHIDEKPPVSKTPIKVDAATAFGTGEHPSTHGCLLALDDLLKKRSYRRVLDMGCGSGILAIASILSKPSARAVASDIDPAAARLARINGRRNGLKDSRLFCVHGNGYSNPVVGAAAPYDLVFANILARPLAALAKDLKAHLAPGGTAILAGLVDWQEAMVLSAHRRVGLKLETRIKVAEWRTLVLRG
ncbi:MAG: 50S ribosomal protein L11 methyltransferase [Alphaproteobacteria bacterium]|nr:50S ribosomal protein L11 methyltransferase [Alphaproteobacteria bacterium]